MGISWNDVDAALMGLSSFVREQDLPYGIAHDYTVDRDFLDALRRTVDGND